MSAEIQTSQKGKSKRKGRKQCNKYEYMSKDELLSLSAGFDMTTDSCSEIFSESESESTHANADAAATSDEIKKFEEKVIEIINNGLTAQSSGRRGYFLVWLRHMLQQRYVGTLLTNKYASLAHIISCSVRRGQDAESRAAAAIAPILALQIGEEGSEEFISQVRPALMDTCIEHSAFIENRMECCLSLSVLCFLLEKDHEKIEETIKMFQTLFSGSYLTNDTAIKSAVEYGLLHAVALDGWSLLLQRLEPAHAHRMLDNQTAPRLAHLLEAHIPEVRRAAGGALVVAHEHVQSGEEPVALEQQLADALPRLAHLARRRNPRATYLARQGNPRATHLVRQRNPRATNRLLPPGPSYDEILAYFQENKVPRRSVSVGAGSVWCSSWGVQRTLCALQASLRGALPVLLPHAPALRRALLLPPVAAAPLPD